MLYAGEIIALAKAAMGKFAAGWGNSGHTDCSYLLIYWGRPPPRQPVAIPHGWVILGRYSPRPLMIGQAFLMFISWSLSGIFLAIFDSVI
jgi:hypothetical protein